MLVKLLYFTLAYMIGIAVGKYFWDVAWISCAFPTWLWLLPLVLLPISSLLNRHPLLTSNIPTMRWPTEAGFEIPRFGLSPALLAACVLCFLMGLLRYASHPLTPCWATTDLAFYNLPANRAFDRAAAEVTLIGYVNSYPLRSDTKQELYVTATKVVTRDGAHDVDGMVRLTTGISERYRYGQRVKVQGRLTIPPDFEDFSYREYLARKGIHSLLYGTKIEQLAEPNAGNPLFTALYALRSRGEIVLNRLLPEPYAALSNGMLLGIEAGIPDELYEQFNLTGTSHTIVISGSNVAIVSTLLMILGLRLFGKQRALWSTLLGIGCYALLVGGDAAVLRAAFMGSLFVIAVALERRSTALISLATACWVMTLINPLTLWDVGFQLSSAATAGLVIFTPGITAVVARIWPNSNGSALGPTQAPALIEKAKGVVQDMIQDGLLVTIAANVTTLPLVLYYFGRLSIVSLLTNLAISPVQPFIMLWGSVGLFLGVIGLSWLAWLCLLVPWLSLAWTVAIVQWTAALPGASLEIANYGFGSLLFTYLVIAVLYGRSQLRASIQSVLAWLSTNGQAKLVGQSAVGVLSISCILIWAGVLSQPDGRLHLYFLDIGQGDGIFIQTPSGRQVLVDGGSSPQQLFSELGDVMPFWDRTIDLLVLTHPDADHMNGQTAVPQRFTVTAAWDTTVSQANPDSEDWRSAMTTAGATVQMAHQGAWLDLGDGVALWVLWPPPNGFADENIDNENSLVLKLVYGEFSVLLTGDAGIPTEQAVVQQDGALTATVLKLGHHGSKGSTSDLFLRAVQPMLAVIQVGAGNDYGHPHQEVLDRLVGRLVLRNDQHGRIHVYTNGSQMWLDTERVLNLLQNAPKFVIPVPLLHFPFLGK